jgi:hypothetical protein
MVLRKCSDFRDCSTTIRKDLMVCASDIILLGGLQLWSMNGAECVVWMDRNTYNVGEGHQRRATLAVW